MYARAFVFVLLVGLIGSLGLTAQQPQPKQPPPAERKGDILKLFVSEFVSITPGKGEFPAKFTLGSAAKDAPASEATTVEIAIAQPFAVAKYEVTQELYEAVMGKNPAIWKGPRNSVEMVDLNESREFCRKVTDELRKTKLIEKDEEIRLPSEAEWEYCAKAGTTTRWSFGDKVEDLGAHCWYKDNSKGNDPPVGKKKGNPWGLYDTYGYISEWTEDSWSDTHKGVPPDGSPRKLKDTNRAVIRGGSFADPIPMTTSTARADKLASHKSDQLGFRCVRAKVRGATP